MSADWAPRMEYFMGGSHLMVFTKENYIPVGYCFDSELNLITVVTVSEPLPTPLLFDFYLTKPGAHDHHTRGAGCPLSNVLAQSQHLCCIRPI